MAFPLLRDAFEGDSAELSDFSAILQRELRQAAQELDSAIRTRDAQAVADLKHKLKTSLQLLGDAQLKVNLARLATDMQGGHAPSPSAREQVVVRLRQLATALEREQW
ncbi:hypothetical protein LEM8419_02472 [Neolewinella maritima]|uniref:Hpt domain-containing protein n=1 Tax=Neolewinella maritima TaxID=1383882 RepID=A0ABN8F8H0_9BACT|nr:hypothetical protein [Neolewinella maritima]CAH1001569.1 hypothetical protein LEM8419_02472 [Neolewinella maritima]